MTNKEKTYSKKEVFNTRMNSFFNGMLLTVIFYSFTMSRPKEVIHENLNPSKLEIISQDLNDDGGEETLMNYDGKSYLLGLSEEGRPMIEDYEIIPRAPHLE